MPIDPIGLFVALPIVALTAVLVYFFRASQIPPSAPPPTRDSPRGSGVQNARFYGYWAASISLSIVYILAGLPKLTGIADVLHEFSRWGYSENFATFIGATEFAAGILLLVPRLSLFAAGYLSIIMTGAVYTHLAFDSPVWALLPLFCLSFLVFIAYEDLARWRAGRV